MIYSIVLLLSFFSSSSAQFWNYNKYEPTWKDHCGAGGVDGPSKTELYFDADETVSIENFSKFVANEGFLRNTLGYDDAQVLQSFRDTLEWAETDFGVTFGNGADACEFYEPNKIYTSDDGSVILLPFLNAAFTYTKVFDNLPSSYDPVPPSNNGNPQSGANKLDDYGNVINWDKHCDFINDGGWAMNVIQPGSVWGGELGGGVPKDVGDSAVLGYYFIDREREDPRKIEKADPFIFRFHSYSPIKFHQDLQALTITCAVSCISHPEIGSGTAMGIQQYYFSPDFRTVRAVTRNVLNLNPVDQFTRWGNHDRFGQI